MREIKAPQEIPESNDVKVFLAGSIEMGEAALWQAGVVEKLRDIPGIVLNPRRDDWDSSWEQTKDDPQFREQVEWESDALSRSDYIILYFDPKTKSPVSLLEMGEYVHSGKLLVVCPDGYWRKGNVDIACEQFGIPQFASLPALLEHLTSLITAHSAK